MDGLCLNIYLPVVLDGLQKKINKIDLAKYKEDCDIKS